MDNTNDGSFDHIHQHTASVRRWCGTMSTSAEVYQFMRQIEPGGTTPVALITSARSSKLQVRPQAPNDPEFDQTLRLTKAKTTISAYPAALQLRILRPLARGAP